MEHVAVMSLKKEIQELKQQKKIIINTKQVILINVLVYECYANKHVNGYYLYD
jgi:hypothetical protein